MTSTFLRPFCEHKGCGLKFMPHDHDPVNGRIWSGLGNMVPSALPEPPPKRNEHPPVADMVAFDTMLLLGNKDIRDDVMARKQMGIEKYGTPLQPFNGRDTLMDLYQELLDAANYMRQYLYEKTWENPNEHQPLVKNYEALIRMIGTIHQTMDLRDE